MKAKNTLIAQTIGMYIMHLPLYAMLITINMTMTDAAQEMFERVTLIAALVLMILMVPVCILNAAVSLKSAIKDNVDPTKITMTIKLCLIPWYALNFLIGFVFVSIFFNPFMMIFIPIVITLLVTSTYILMLTTSLGDVAYFVHNIRKNAGFTISTTIAVIFMFIFCLDVIGSIILYKKSQKLSETERENTAAE